jgi:hypothetical protein
MPEMEHNPKLVERLARMHEGNAVAHMKRAAQPHEADASRPGWSQDQMLAASSFVIAASYWSLIDPHRATEGYRNATKVYRDMGHDYWIVLAVATANSNWTVPMLSAVDEMRAPSPQTVAFAMVCNEMYDSYDSGPRTERLNSRWREIGNYPIGRLGIPLDYYARCARAMRIARGDRNVERFFAEAANYVHRAAEVLRSASHDRFHWLRLESTILPAEPEAVAMTTAMSVMSHTMFKTPISKVPNLDAHGRLLVEIGDEMRGAATGDNARQR